MFDPIITFDKTDATAIGQAVTRVFDVLSESDKERVRAVVARGLTKLIKQNLVAGEPKK